MMPRRCAAFAALFAFLALGARTARASDCNSTLASTCIDSDTFWPHAGPSRFLGVGGVETIAPGQVGFGLVTSYLSRPITIHTSSPGPTGGGGAGEDQYAVNDQVNGSFLWGYGVSDRLELDFVLPVTFAQGGTGVAPITGGTGLNTTAVRDLRFGFAYALVQRPRVAPDLPPESSLGRKSLFGLTARMEVSAPSGDRDQFAGERTAVWIPSLAGDFRYGKLFAGLELGARLRPATELNGARVGTEGVVGVGVGYDILPRELLSATLEARVLPNFAEQHDVTVTPEGTFSSPNGIYRVPAEWTAAVRTVPLFGGDLALQLGGGGAFTGDSGVTTPRFRFTLSIRYAPLARDTDGDGVLDRDDKCPERAGKGGDGCPKAPGEKRAHVPFNPPLDAAIGRCNDEPESGDGFRTDDGCPDEDSDKDGIPDRTDKCPLQPEDFAGLAEGCPDKKQSP